MSRQRFWADPDRHRRVIRNGKLKAMYGITLDDYEAKLAAQGGVCAICFQPETTTRGGRVIALAVDHDKACCPGKTSCGRCVRDLLCGQCNNLIGRAREQAAVLRSAAEYVERYAA